MNETKLRTTATGGANLWQGWQNLVEDAQRHWAQSPPLGTEAYQVGQNVAMTPGAVILRNWLIELIQYAPVGKLVRPEPILIVPSRIIMWDKGYLDSSQMTGAFHLMNSDDLVWSRALNHYLLGERSGSNDLIAWNADGTRLPYRMHTEYLRRMFLNNDLASGRYPVNGKPVALIYTRCPIYCIGTVRDHVARWRSVHKLHLLTNVEITFLLTSGGHNVGIVNPPGVPGRSFQVLTRQHDGKYLDPDAWLQVAAQHEGSWWSN